MADTISTAKTLTNTTTESNVLRHNGGKLYFTMQGVFNGATVTVHACDTEDGTFGVATNADGGGTISQGAGTDNAFYYETATLGPCFVKAVATSTGASTSLRTKLISRA